jgi:hypothetical protein
MFQAVRSLLVVAVLATFALASPTGRALPSGNVGCGSHTYTVNQVVAAVNGGVAHINNPIGSGAFISSRSRC